jgi:hypothetical protein
MTQQRLSDFIRGNIEAILQTWEDFARTVEPPALTMDDQELRDHAHQMLMEFADDLDRPQSDRQRVAKSHGLAEREVEDTAAETHAEARLLSGYTVVQLVSEYRALRASVLSLWGNDTQGDQSTDMGDMTRFNEAVDQALAESVARYEKLSSSRRICSWRSWATICVIRSVLWSAGQTSSCGPATSRPGMWKWQRGCSTAPSA